MQSLLAAWFFFRVCFLDSRYPNRQNGDLNEY